MWAWWPFTTQGRLFKMEGRIRHLEKTMGQLSDVVASLTEAYQDLESQVKAHEAKDVAAIADLTAQIDALKNQPNPEVQDAVAKLTALRDSIKSFDASQTPVVPTVPANPA